MQKTHKLGKGQSMEVKGYWSIRSSTDNLNFFHKVHFPLFPLEQHDPN